MNSNLKAILFAGAIAAFTHSAVRAAEPLRIGLLLSLSGPAAAFGIPERDAVEVLAAKINADGGVNGRKIELSVYDDNTNPTEAARGATQLIQERRVVAIIGSTTGSGTLASAPIAMRYSVPMLAPNGTVAVTAKENKFSPWVFRTMPSDVTNTKAMFNRGAASGAKRIAVFHQEDAYGKEAVPYLTELAKANGAEIVTVAAAPLNATDVSAQVIKIRSANPDVVLLQVSVPALGAAFARAARQSGMTTQIWGPMGLTQKTFVEGVGVAGEGIKVAGYINWEEPTAQQAEFAKLLAAAGKTPAGFGELLSTNGLYAIVEASKAIQGEVTGARMRDELAKLCQLRTLMRGSACYRQSNDGWLEDITIPLVLKGGKFVTER